MSEERRGTADSAMVRYISRKERPLRGSAPESPHVAIHIDAIHATAGTGVHAENVEPARAADARGAAGHGHAGGSVSKPDGHVRNARSGGGRAQDRRAQGDRKLAHDEPQLHADEHQDTRMAEGFAGGAARGGERGAGARAQAATA